MTQKGQKYISEIMSRFFNNRYSVELEGDIQNWIIDDTFPEEKEAAMHNVWENLSTEADISTYVSLRKIQEKLGMQNSRPVRKALFSLSRVAAILIPLFFIIGGYYLFLHKSVSMIELSASYGEITHTILSDGTEVWINSGSTIIYDENFKASERIASLSGEACFDVEKHRSKPFVVKTEHLNVRVLGTQLNIRAFNEEERSIVTLATGAVTIETKSGKSYEINPNQQLIYNNITSEVSIVNVDASNFMGWRSGSLLFDNATFEEIISDVERHYNISIIIDENLDLPDDIYTLRFVNHENIEQALAVLYKLIGGFGYDISDDGATIYIYKSETTPAQQEIPETITNTPPVIDAAPENYFVSIDSKEMSYKEIFELIESQTGYTIGFNQSKFNASRILTGVSYVDADFEEILTDILNETGFTYQIAGKHILIIEASGLQSISGYIFDSDNGWPITNALVNCGNNKNVRTDRNGYFLIEYLKPGDYPISISASGYNLWSQKVSLAEGGEGSILRVQMSETNPIVTTKVPDDTMIVTTPTYPSIVQSSDKTDRSYFVIKSNLLYLLGTYSPNLAFEFSLSNRFTLDMQFGYNPFSLSDGRQYKHMLLQPELRYWPTFAFNKHFFGLHTNYGTYDIAKVGSTYMKSRIYDGNFVGVGISYGYNFKLGRKWALEGTIGAGYIMFNYNTIPYDEYMEWDEPARDNIKEYRIKRRDSYFGITKLGISITYEIK